MVASLPAHSHIGVAPATFGNCSQSCSSGGQSLQTTLCSPPGRPSRTASFVAQTTTSLPCCWAAVATRKATRTRSPSSIPVARLISTLSLPAIVSSFASSLADGLGFQPLTSLPRGGGDEEAAGGAEHSDHEDRCSRRRGDSASSG